MSRRLAYMTTSNHSSYGGGWIRDALLVKTIRSFGQPMAYYSTFFKPFIEDSVDHDCLLFGIKDLLLAHNIPRYYKFPVFPYIDNPVDNISSKIPYINKIGLEKIMANDLESITAKLTKLESKILDRIPREIRIRKEYEILDSVLTGSDGKLKREVVKLENRLKKDNIGLLNSCEVLWSKVTSDVKKNVNLVDIATLQGYDMVIGAYPQEYKREALLKIRENAKQTDGFIAVSKYYAKKAGSELNIPAKKIKVIYNGVDTHKYKPLDIKKGKIFTIMFLGRIDLYKGLLTLVFAAKHVKDEGYGNFRVYAAGSVDRDASYINVVRDYISLLGLGDMFEIAHSISTEEKISRLNMADVVVYPTVHPEPFGLVPIESMACGTPVILPNHGAFPEIVNETKGGLLFGPNDSMDLAKKIIMLMEDSDMQNRLSGSGLNSVVSKFSAETFAESVLNVYKEYE